MAQELSKISYDVANLKTQATAMRRILNELVNAKNELRSSLDSLKGEWQSDAATKFFDTYDTAWVGQVEAYEQRLEDLAAALDAAASEYGALEAAYKQVKLG